MADDLPLLKMDPESLVEEKQQKCNEGMVNLGKVTYVLFLVCLVACICNNFAIHTAQFKALYVDHLEVKDQVKVLQHKVEKMQSRMEGQRQKINRLESVLMLSAAVPKVEKMYVEDEEDYQQFLAALLTN